MKTIDMNDFYVDPLLYGNPPQTEVSDEVAEALWQFMRDEQAADRRVRRAKAYYSLDCGDEHIRDPHACPLNNLYVNWEIPDPSAARIFLNR